MINPICSALLALSLSGCAFLTPRVSRPPLSPDGEVLLYLQPWPAEATRLTFTLEAIAALRADGAPVPLELSIRELPGPNDRNQRLLASGRLPPGAYRGLELTVVRATLIGQEGPAQLGVPREPVALTAPFDIAEGRATVLVATLRYESSFHEGYTFSPSLAIVTPPWTLTALQGFCTNAGSNEVTVFDKRRREVSAVVASGREPLGLAIAGPPLPRLYVALAAEDHVAVHDLVSGRALPTIRLSPGDRPRELALSPDGRRLLVMNEGSNTLSFVDTNSGLETTRVPVGIGPTWLLVDRSWRRAYVLNAVSNTITIVDVSTRAVVATLSTEAGPFRAQLNRAGTRLYVIHSASPQLNVYSVPEYAPAGQVNVGLGTSALKVDSRTDLIYMAHRGDPHLDVYDAFSLIPVDTVDLPGAATMLAIDDTENTLLAVLSGAKAVAVIDLASRALLATVPVGEEPYRVAVAGERY